MTIIFDCIIKSTLSRNTLYVALMLNYALLCFRVIAILCSPDGSSDGVVTCILHSQNSGSDVLG